ncbi:MAG: serine/threonine protein kinase [Acidobacteria bacterium]|nr:serine/threonine protein kinase [Acidobacteriota bacterium]
MDETRAGTHPGAPITPAPPGAPITPAPPGAPITSTSAGLSGLVLCGRYRLDRLIGSGGMAQVWEGTDTVLARRVAVKLLHPHLATDPLFVERFRQEAKAAASINDPGVVGVFDTCSDGEREAIVMELLDATTLRDLLDERGALDAATTERVGLRVLDALEAAHRAGLVHRDIKPSNILLCRDGRVKLADFGIAVADGQTQLTQEGSLVGTATYLAPEQLQQVDLDGRADLYSLGVVLYECVTGRSPFDGDTAAAVALARLHTAPLDPRQVRADVPHHLAEVLMVALAMDPNDRFSTAADFRAALLGGSVHVPGPPTGFESGAGPDHHGEDPESFTASERGWLLPALMIVLVGAALTVAGLLVRESRQEEVPTEPATTTPAQELEPLAIARVGTFDPQGSGTRGENDGDAPAVADGDPATGWQTELYDERGFFGAKTGVGVALVLESRSLVDRVRIQSGDDGWSGSVYVIDAESTDAIDLGRLTPSAEVQDVRGTIEVDTRGAPGRLVLLWITELGEAQDGRHSVRIDELSARGRPAQG